jgi:DNA-binding SARP family transcriptional activator/tetratricopeptide (TPR) repeat protein
MFGFHEGKRLSGKGLEIRLLGELELLRDGQALRLPASKKSRALLGYLVATGRPQLRERLCELLWEGPDDPRAALRWSLTKIRPLLGDQRIVADREHVAFEACGAAIDVANVGQLVGTGANEAPTESLRLAATLFRGELLEGLDLPDCYRFAQWLAGEREAARTLRLRIISTLVERCRTDPQEALRWARAQVALDPTSEAAHAEVLRLLGDLGRAREALQQYESCRRILELELGARPSGQLERARMALGQVAAEPPVPQPARTVPRALPLPSLVGRLALRSMLRDATATAVTGHARGVVLFVGEPGIGKSRLLEEAKALTLAAHGSVLAGRAFEAEMVRPYGPWIDALRSARLSGAEYAAQPDLAPLLPELGTPSAQPPDRNRLFDAVVQLLGRAGQATLILDDLHWIDEASAALLHYVARALGDSHLLIACGARPGELADNPAALRLVRALAREGLLAQHSLGPLDADETAELVRTLDPSLDLGRVVADSEGNPLFALEIARSLASGAPSSLSDSLEGLIADRLGRLDDRTRELLPWAAALGHGFSPEILAQVAGLPLPDLLAAVEELESRSVIRVVSQSGYDFAHDLIRQAAYRQLSGPRRRLVHLQIARAMATLSDPEGALAGELAHHASLGGDSELAARSCLRAGERCWRMFANAEAIDVIDRGLCHLRTVAPAVRVELHIPLLKYKCFATVGSWSRLAPTLDTDISSAVEEARSLGHPSMVTEGLFVLSAMHHDSQDFRRAEEATLQAAEAARAADLRTLAEQLANTGRCLLHIEGDITRARAIMSEAQVLARRVGLETPEIDWGTALIHYWDGELDAASEDLERAYAMACARQDRWREHQNLEWIVRIGLERDWAEGVRGKVAALLEVASKMGDGSEAVFAHALEALVDIKTGRWEALGRIDDALGGLRAADSRLHLAYVHNFVALLALGRSEVDLAERHARAAFESAQVVRRRSEVAIARALLARVALARGQDQAAREVLHPVLAQASDPNLLTARARGIVGDVARTLGLPIPTGTPTVPTTAAT